MGAARKKKPRARRPCKGEVAIPQIVSEEQLLTKEQAAAMLNISRASLDVEAKRQRIAVTHVGERSVRFTVRAVREYITQNTTSAVPPRPLEAA